MTSNTVIYLLPTVQKYSEASTGPTTDMNNEYLWWVGYISSDIFTPLCKVQRAHTEQMS